MMAGVIGLGGEYLDGKPYETVEEIIHTALDGGVTLMDLFMPGPSLPLSTKKIQVKFKKSSYKQEK